MIRRSWKLAGLLTLLVGAPLAIASGPVTSSGSQTDFEFYHENVLGTSCELRVRAASRWAAEGAEGRVLREIDRLAAIFNGYDAASELSRWQNRGVAARDFSRTLRATRGFGLLGFKKLRRF